MTDRRLIEVAFPLKQASLDSVYEKNVRHGHISTLHIWPARRPLAACRAALLATLLPDPGTPESRQELCERIGGKVVKQIERKKGPGAKGEDTIVEKTVGGVLRWGRETENRADIDFFRDQILRAFGGRTPRVLDPFAGGGAIPLEAMRLGCAVTALDINPVAWFILKCTLEYPQKLAGQRRPLPEFVRRDAVFMDEFFRSQGFKGAGLRSQLRKLGLDEPAKSGQTSLTDTLTGKELDIAIEEHTLDADLGWHVRAWGSWVLSGAKRELASLYPVYADFQPLKDVADWSRRHQDLIRPTALVPFDADGTANTHALNSNFPSDYLADSRNPRWVAKPAVAYLWARTVKCKNCRATLPLLKTRWLARTAAQRVVLAVTPSEDARTVTFAILSDVPRAGGNNAQRREHDRRIGLGTMSRSGATCPCCGVIMSMEDLRAEGKSGRMSRMMTAVAVKGPELKEFRLPTEAEQRRAWPAPDEMEGAAKRIPYGLPEESIVEDAKKNTWCVQYGVDTFSRLFTERQLVAMAALVAHARSARSQLKALGEPDDWVEAISSYLAASISRLTDYFNCGAQWKLDRATINHLFVRYALPVSWDFAEGNVLGDLPGSYDICLQKIAVAVDAVTRWNVRAPSPRILRASAGTGIPSGDVDLVMTDPPYYNAIGYAVLMDYFYVWLRRMVHDLSPDHEQAFSSPLTPKWDSEAQDGELVDDASRHGGDGGKSKAAYEAGMARVFRRSREILASNGRLVVVFAHKEPDAWDSLVSAIIQAGFVVDGSWPIQTEQGSRMRALSSAALASSVWLACRERSSTARPGWDNAVLDEMRKSVGQHLREFWDAGIRGPDFVWAATGPALEAYSKHPIVKKANNPGQLMTVSEFLSSVRRMVVEFVVGRVLAARGESPADPTVGPH